MPTRQHSDAEVIAGAQRLVAGRRKIRWLLHLNATLFLGFCIYFTLVGIRNIETLDDRQLSTGFVFGLGLAVAWTSFGIIGAFFLAKARFPLTKDCRTEELLLKYHDRLRELGKLPEDADADLNSREHEP